MIASLPGTIFSLLNLARVKWKALAACIAAIIALFGVIYLFGDRALFGWYRLAAELGSADAQYNVGSMYWQGIGVERNEVEGVKWIKLAAENGNLNAQSDMGIIYFNGYGGLDLDYDEAVKWLQLAAEKGHAQAQNDLAFSYADGLVPWNRTRNRQ